MGHIMIFTPSSTSPQRSALSCLAPVFGRLGLRGLFGFALLPGVLIGVLFFYAIYENERAHLEDRALQTARALTQVVDRDLLGVASKLQALATAPALLADDWPSFRTQAQAVLEREMLGQAVFLRDERGRVIVHTGISGESSEERAELASLERFNFRPDMAVSALRPAQGHRAAVIDVSVPVWRGGKVRYLLGMEIPVERLGKMLTDQHLPMHWLATLLDFRGVVLSRSLNPTQSVGKLATPDLLAMMNSQKEGNMASRTLEGTPSFLAFSRGVSGYVVVVAATRQVLYDNLQGPLALAGLLVLAFLATGVILAWLLSQSIRDSLRALIGAIEAATHGDLTALAPLDGPKELVRLAEQFNAMQSARRHAEEKLHLAAAAFESQEAMVITDAQGVILRANRAFSEVTGYSGEELVGKNPRLLKSDRHDADFFCQMWDTILRTGIWQGEIWDRRKNGEIYPKWLTIAAVKNAQGVVTHYIGTHSDLTERKKAEQKIEELAFFDQLTGLPNRLLLLDRLKQALANSARTGEYGALLFIDLDHFKTFNDSQGHMKGDQLLRMVAQRLTSCLREGDTPARIGGDEFVVVLGGLKPLEREAASAAEIVVEKILSVLQEEYVLGDVNYQGTASIGVTLFKGEQTMAVDEIMKQADLAMYKAKATGRNAARFFDPTLESSLKERLALERDLRQAVDQQQFLLHYQPQVCDDGSLTGAEALVRWRHPERGMVSPADFIPLAEETGLILPLGNWVLETACRQLAQWKERPEMAHLTIAVNVSASQLHQPDFVEQVLAVVDATGANPACLKLELTESQLVNNVQEIIAKMMRLKDRGIRFSLDDFGTGYSSLSYLKRLPLDQLKIDQSFVRDVLTDPNDAAIARTIVALANSLTLNVIAEGVETREQRDFLAHSGCFAYQGYYFGRPLPGEEFERLARDFLSGVSG